MCSSSTHIPTGSYRLMSAIFLFAEPFGGKWVGRCRIFFLKTSWEPDLGWIYGLCYRMCAGNVCLSRNLGSHSSHMCVILAPLQNGNEPPEHKNCFLHNPHLTAIIDHKKSMEMLSWPQKSIFGLLKGCVCASVSSCSSHKLLGAIAQVFFFWRENPARAGELNIRSDI